MLPKEHCGLYQLEGYFIRGAWGRVNAGRKHRQMQES